MKLTQETLKLVLQLPSDTQSKLDQLIKRHVRACEKLGAPLEGMDRVVLEGIQLLQLEEKHPAPAIVEMTPSNGWPETRYEQYRSPREL